MDDFILNWLVLVGVFSLALISPGPDFVMAVRNSVLFSRRAGVLTAIGFGLGICIHVAYCIAGLALLIQQSVILFNILKVIGAAYLFYMGYKALKSKGAESLEILSKGDDALSDIDALRSGFLTNLLNPKATMFFLALFTQIMGPDVTMGIQIMYGLTCVAMTILWFSIVATILTAPIIRAQFLKMSRWIDRVCGAFFILLGIKLVLSKTG
jgi:RhtB (resistance to homoserine/threonine) family protein